MRSDFGPLPVPVPASVAPRFDVAVPDSGYRWWYVDGLSDDGRHSIVVIAFIGSVFSPYYFRARQRGDTDPEHYCAVNVGLYRPKNKLWAMTERGRDALSRDAGALEIGASAVRWRGDRLEIDLRERSAPAARRLSGRIVLRPDFTNGRSFSLDSNGRHSWQPIAPSARIEVRLDSPSLSWDGDGYFDTNAGARALEDDFLCWHWSCAKRPTETVLSYDLRRADGSEHALGLRFRKSGDLEETELPAAVRLPPAIWRVRREARSEGASTVHRTLEDTPFYVRSLLNANDAGGSHPVMHESLDLCRFKAGWVRTLLPFRMPRRPGRPAIRS